MFQAYSAGKNIYSVDMMFSYIEIYKPKYKRVKVKKLLNNLELNCWGDPKKGRHYSPIMVIKDPSKKKYERDVERILNADLSYPIITNGKYVIDGIHRLTKAYLDDAERIKVYRFSNKQLAKFIINTNGDWDQVSQLTTFNYISLFHNRFTRK
jgi:hypothetical protein